jgi:porin
MIWCAPNGSVARRQRIVARTVIALFLVMPAIPAAGQGGQQPSAVAANAAQNEPAEAPAGLLDRQTLTDDWFGFGRQLESAGLAVRLTLVQVYQQNLHGGLSTHRHSGRYTGGYDLELEADLEKIARLPGGSVYALGEGSWSDGIAPSSVESWFGVNADAMGYRSLDLAELWYEQSFLDERLIVRVGKLDLTGGFQCRGCCVAFDGSAFANDQTTQFLNGALVNNPSIPFPDRGLGAVVYFQPAEWWYTAAGVGDAQADARETGFNTAFHDEDYFFSIYETGVTPQLPSANGPLQGAYRIGMWHDPRDKARFDGSGAKHDDVGTYVSLDQALCRESDREDDTQGLGVFARYGLADGKVNPIRCFWSAGVQYQGPIPTRDYDVVAFGAAQGLLSPDMGLSAAHETVLEAYYGIQVAPWLLASPSIQYVFNPGGDGGAGDAVIIGFRLCSSF